MTLDHAALRKLWNDARLDNGQNPYVDLHNETYSVWQDNPGSAESWQRRIEHGEFGVGESGKKRAQLYLAALNALPALLDENERLEKDTARQFSRIGELAETLRETVSRAAQMDASLRARIAELEKALGQDLAGRSFNELLMTAAMVCRTAGGGPLQDCLEAKAAEVCAALGGDGKESGNG